ncbi:hypothetical protein ACHAWF_013977 [Thalassiosira exigua]
MTDNVLTARSASSEGAHTEIGKLSLAKTSDGHFNRNDATIYGKGVLRALLGMLNPGNSNDMAGLLDGPTSDATIRHIAKSTFLTKPTVRFDAAPSVLTFDLDQEPVYVTYDMGADGHYISEDDRARVQLPILRPSTKRVGVRNSSTSTGTHRMTLPFHKLSNKANEADSFDDFPYSLMSVGKVVDDNAMSIFMKHSAAAYKEEDALITCKGEPILVGVRNEHGRYRVPLIQQQDQWQPRVPTKRVCAALEQAHSIYDLPSVEQGIKWIHAVCGYSIQSMWLNQGWQLPRVAATQRTERQQILPQHGQNPKGAPQPSKEERTLNQIACAAFSGSEQQQALRKEGARHLHGHIQRAYLMVTVEIDSSNILVEPIKSRSDDELKRAYHSIMRHLNRANVFSKKHLMDTEVYEQLKNMIWDEFKMQLELIPPGCHR